MNADCRRLQKLRTFTADKSKTQSRRTFECTQFQRVHCFFPWRKFTKILLLTSAEFAVKLKEKGRSGGVSMQLEKRNMDILLEILKNKHVKTTFLLEKFTISRNQLDYAIKKINLEISDEGYLPISRTKKGEYHVDPSLVKKYRAELTEKNQDEEVLLKESERQKMICLLIFCGEYLSLFHFEDELEVSKNTVLKDIKKINETVEKFGVTVSYSRKKGYFFTGKEEEIRRYILLLVNDLLLNPYGERMIKQYLKFLEPQLDLIDQGIGRFEKEIATRFTDKVRMDAPFMLTILLRRIENGHYLSESLGITINDLSDTREYEALGNFFDSDKLHLTFDSIPENERLYLTLVLLSLKVTQIGGSISVNLLALKSAIEAFVVNFEKNAAIHLNDKEKIINSLLVHMKSAIYRIKYQLTTSYPYSEAMAEEIRPLLNLVKISIQPVEEFLQTKIQDNELFYITSFFSAHLFCSENKFQPIEPKKGIVVCHSGVITSKILEMKLSQALPMIHFSSALSIGDFLQRQENTHFDYVFSTSPITDAKGKIILVDDINFDDSKDRIIEEVLNSYHYADNLNSIVQQLVVRVKDCAVIDDQTAEQLKTDFTEILNFSTAKQESQLVFKSTKRQSALAGYITENAIQIVDRKLSWKEVLIAGTQSLIKRKLVTEEYLTALISQYPVITPNIVLANSIVIPHTSPENGVLQTGMAFMKLKHGVQGEHGEYKIIVVIAAERNGKHIPAMLQLLAMAKNMKLMESLEAAKNSSEILDLLIHSEQTSVVKDVKN